MLLKISRNKLVLFKSELTSVDISASVLLSFPATIRRLQMGGLLASAMEMLRLLRIKQTNEGKKKNNKKSFQAPGNKITPFLVDFETLWLSF